MNVHNDQAGVPASAPILSAPVLGTSLTTKEEWFEFVHAQPPKMPEMPSKRELASFSAAQKTAFDEERIQYHTAFPPIAVPAMKNIHSDMLPLIKGNVIRQPGARRGGIIDGPGGVGKTTNLTLLGKRYEMYMRELYPNPRTQAGEEFIPVVYVTLPAATTIKGLNLALARFYGAVVSSKATKDQLGYVVMEHARRCATSLILVDDFHFLNMRDKESRRVNDHLKYLANSISATFVYAGIECENSGLLNEGRSEHEARFSQTRRRFGLYRVEPFSNETQASRKEWASFLKTVESKLILTKTFDGMLYDKLADYLFDRTGGYIGSITELVRHGTSLAIRHGEERITKGILNKVVLDYAAEVEGVRRGVVVPSSRVVVSRKASA